MKTKKIIIAAVILTLALGSLGVLLKINGSSAANESGGNYIYIAEHKPFNAWQHTRGRTVKSFLFDTSGDVQYIERGDSQIVRDLREGRMDFEHVQDVFSNHWPERDPGTEKETEDSDEPQVITHDHPGYFQVVVALSGEPVRFWEGPEEDMPAPWSALIEESRDRLSAVEEKEEAVVAWLQTRLFTPEAAWERIRADVVDLIVEEDLSSSPQLEEALLNPFKIFPIYKDENPFTPLGWSSYKPGRSAANVSWRDSVFRVCPMRNGIVSE